MTGRRVSRFIALAGIAGVFVLATPVAASSDYVAHRSRAQIVSVAFRLQVAGNPGFDATFWVAYGPTDGHFGLVRLRSLGDGVFQAVDRIRRGTQSIFAYLEGHGVIKTRFGAAPGNPVITIKAIGPTTVVRAGSLAVRWRAPTG